MYILQYFAFFNICTTGDNGDGAGNRAKRCVRRELALADVERAIEIERRIVAAFPDRQKVMSDLALGRSSARTVAYASRVPEIEAEVAAL